MRTITRETYLMMPTGSNCFHCNTRAFISIEEVFFDDESFSLLGCCQANIDDWISCGDDFSEEELKRWFFMETGIFLNHIRISHEDISIRI